MSEYTPISPDYNAENAGSDTPDPYELIPSPPPPTPEQLAYLEKLNTKFPAQELNHEELRRFLTWFVLLVVHRRMMGLTLEEKDGAGFFVVSAFGEHQATLLDEKALKLESQQFVIANDEAAVENLVAAFAEINQQPGLNAYLSIGLYQHPKFWKNQHPKARGSAHDVIGPVVFVGDFDLHRTKGAEEYDKRLPFTPGVVVETSPGSHQPWLALAPSDATREETQEVFHALTCAMGGDSTHSIEHIFRPPGTWNWPTKKKVDSRKREPGIAVQAHLVGGIVRRSMTVEELRAATLAMYPTALEDVRRKPAPKTIGSGGGRGNALPPPGFDWNASWNNKRIRLLSDDVLIKKLNMASAAATQQGRSEVCYGVISMMRVAGYTPNTIAKEFQRLSYCAAVGHYKEHPSGFEDSLQRDIRKNFENAAVGPTKRDRPKVFRPFAGGPAHGSVPRRRIELANDFLPAAVEATERALIEQGVGIFQRGDMLVRPGEAQISISGGREVIGERLFEVHAVELAEHATAAAAFWKWDSRNSAWTLTNCPPNVAQSLLERRGRWSFPELVGIITAPTLRADGTLLDTPGYDEATKLLYVPRPGIAWLPVPEKPTQQDAEAALNVLIGLIGSFPFTSPASRSVALSAILTGVVRRLLPTAPLHAYSAPDAGHGKGKLVDTAAIIGTGREATAYTQGETEAETEKRVGSLLILGDAALLMDNANLPIRGRFLEALMTRNWRISVRILGQSRSVDLPNTAMQFVTGNNLVVSGDMSRRIVLCHIDAKVEDPERLPFATDPVVEAKANRPKYLAAALTVLRAFIVAGAPKQVTPLGSFEQWSRLVRDALLWLGQADPCETTTAIKAENPERLGKGEFLALWHAVLGEQAYTVADAVARVVQLHIGTGPVRGIDEPAPSPEHAARFLDVLRRCSEGGRGPGGSNRRILDGDIDPHRVGFYARALKDAIVGGRKIVKVGEDRNGIVMWRVVRVART